MSYFTGGFTRDKLIALYFLRSIGIELTRGQMTTALNGIVQYFELQSAINELEESALLASVPRACGNTFALTPHGTETLDMFEKRLPQSVRDELDDRAEESREELQNDKQLAYDMEKTPNGACLVTLKILEQNDELMSLKLMFPDVQSANRAATVWKKKAESVYATLVGELY